MKTTSSIETIVRAGGSVIIDSSIMTTSLEKIAKAANGKTVIFDLT